MCIRDSPVVALGLTGPQLACLLLLGALALYYGRRVRGVARAEAA